MDEYDVIETPEHVEFQQRLAGIGSRFIAGLIDTLILGLVYLLLALVLLLTLGAGVFSFEFLRQQANWWVLGVMILVFFALYWGYYVFFELRMNGQSPGKRSQKLRVVKEGGAAIQFVDVAIRNLLRIVDGLGAYAIAGLTMFLSKKVQRLGDLAAGTVVIAEDVRDYAAFSDRRRAIEWEKELSSAELATTGLRPEEYKVLHNYWARRSELTHHARVRVLPKLLRPIAERLGRAFPEGMPLLQMEDLVDQLLLKTQGVDQPPARPPEPAK